MTELMEPNRIPAAPIIEVIQGYLRSEGQRLGAETYAEYPITLLAERADLNRDTLEKTIAGRQQTIDFDIADRLLCVMNMTDLWLTDLAPIYAQAHLSDGPRHAPRSASGSRICARRGCSARFVIPARSPKKRFCSNNCRSTAWKHSTDGVKTNILGKDRSLQALVCRNGHERTKENTGKNWKGHRFCLICHKESQRIWESRNRSRLQAASP